MKRTAYSSPVSRIFYGVLLGLSLQQPPAAFAEVLGGYIDSGERRAIFVTQETAGTRAVLAHSNAAIVIGRAPAAHAGKLIAVDADGAWRVVPRIVDGSIVIEAPRNTSSKVVFLDERDDVVGGIGLAPAEMSAIIAARNVPSARQFDALINRTGASAWYGAVHAAGAAVARAGLRYESDRSQLLRQQLSSNPSVRDAVTAIRSAAIDGDALGDTDTADAGLRGLASNVFGRAVTTDGQALIVGGVRRSTGGTVLFGQDESLVAHDGNGASGGGSGLVAHDGNGASGGGSGLVAIPFPKDLSVSCIGAMLYIY